MTRKLYFISHPNVVIDRDIPVPQWPLSEVGRERMKKSLPLSWIPSLASIYCSTEQKAIDGAQILADHLSLDINPIPELGENDRSSTGFLKPDEFETVADEFFLHPSQSVRGWETAADAQARIVRAVTALADSDKTSGSIAIVSHGAVGSLFYCHLSGHPISRRWDQPPNGGGNYFAFQMQPPRAFSWWKPIDPIES